MFLRNLLIVNFYIKFVDKFVDSVGISGSQTIDKLKQIDSNIHPPNHFRNLKRKYLSSKYENNSEIVSEFYKEIYLGFGKNSDAIDLNQEKFHAILNNPNLKINEESIVTYGVALELFKYVRQNDNKYTIHNLIHVICFLSGRFSNQVENLRTALKRRIEQAECMRSTGPSYRTKIMLKKDLFEKEKKVLKDLAFWEENHDKVILDHTKKLKEVLARNEKLWAENEKLKIEYERERIASETAGKHYLSLENKMNQNLEYYLSNTNNMTNLIYEGQNIGSKQKIKLQNLVKELERQMELKDAENNILNIKQRELEEKIKNNEEEIAKQTDTIFEERKKKRKAQKEASRRRRLDKNCQDNDQFQVKIKELQEEIKYLEDQKTLVEDEFKKLQKDEPSIFKNKDGSYKNTVRACFQDLILNNVGVKVTRKVIISVLKFFANIEIEEKELPGETFARQQYCEARVLAMLQLRDVLGNDNNMTLQSDATTKRGRKFNTYDDSEFASKAAISIKNLMSDRHATQIKFNKLFEDYRKELLPLLRSDWNDLNEEEKQNASRINSFFCGLHFLVGLSEQAEIALKNYESLTDEPFGSTIAGGAGIQGNESGTLRLIRTFAKALSEHGCEKSGQMNKFLAHLETNGIGRNPIAKFRGNRFNIIFLNGGTTYYLSDIANKFLDVTDKNKLLNAVQQDLTDIQLAGCKALGLINKYLTGPLWRLFTKTENILDLSEHYQKMFKISKDLSRNASPIMNGKVQFFDDISIHEDEVHKSLMTENENKNVDKMCKEILELLFGTFSIQIQRVLVDYLHGGKFDSLKNDPRFREEVKSCPTTDVFPESNFGFLDRLMREKPNALDITYEAIIMAKYNNMGRWRDSLALETKQKYMDIAKKRKFEFLNAFKAREKKLRETIKEYVLDLKRKKQRKRQKN